MNFKQRLNQDGNILRIYENGTILLSEPEKPVGETSQGAIPHIAPGAESIETCLLCDNPSMYWGIFMTVEEAVTYAQKREAQTEGTFFGLCREHDPYKNEDEVCDLVYGLMEGRLEIIKDLQMAQLVIETWFVELNKGGRSRKDSLEIILSMLEAGKLTEGYQFPRKVKEAIEIVLIDELRKEEQ